MPYCPQCRYEFEAEIERCPDCDTPLVEQLPEDAPIPEVKWVALHSLPARIYADMVEEALRNNNIPFFTKADFLQSAFGIAGTSISGGKVTIYVPEKDFQKASDILSQMLNHI